MSRRDLGTTAPAGATVPDGASEIERGLALRARDGDLAAAEELALRLLPRVQNLARYLVRGDAEAEDTAQEAMLVVLERLDAFRGEGRFVAWVDGVVMRVAVGRQRKQRRRGRHHVDAPSAVEEVASTASSGSRYVLRREAVTALDALPLSQRHVVVLHHVLGYSVREIAGELDLPGETVRSRLRLGISKLRASFVGAEEGPSADAPLPPGGSRQRPPARGDEEGTT